MKRLAILLLSLLVLPIKGQAQEETQRAEQWFVMANASVQERQEYLHRQFIKYGKLQPGIHNTPLANYGNSFAFNGEADIVFARELLKRAKQHPKVLIPAFGVGRTVMDALILHEHAQVYANEIQESGFQQLHILMEKYGQQPSRVIDLKGDILEILKDLKASTMDVIYAANLLHFFNPFQVERFLQLCKRVLKPDGIIIINWQGARADMANYASIDFSLFVDQLKVLEKLEVPHPHYIEEKDFHTTSKIVIYPYYLASVADMKRHVHRTSFNIEASGSEECLAMGIPLPGQHQTVCVLGNCFSLPVSTIGNRAHGAITNYLVLSLKKKDSPGGDEEGLQQQTYQQEQEFLNARRSLIRSSLCAYCDQKSQELKICSRCKKIRYCNSDCQKQHWSQHKLECQKFIAP